VELNKDDPRWRERVAAIVEDIYEQKKEDRKQETKNKHRKRRGYGENGE
jgi:hypothetical protein